jgi:hypothetical protein
MFQSQFRRPRPATRPAVRFTPRLEALDGRIAPGGAYGGVLGDARLATAAEVRSVGPDHIGEEIPQAGPTTPAGHVDHFGGISGSMI